MNKLNYNEKSKKSGKDVLEFSLKNNIIINQNNNRIYNENDNTIYIQKNNISIYKDQIRRLELAEDNIDKIRDIIFSVDIGNDNFRNRIIEIEGNIANLESYFKQNDNAIKDLKNRRSSLILMGKRQYISTIKGLISEAESLLNTIVKPKDILIKYNELIRKDAINQEILSEIIRERRLLALEKERVEKPWELISQPILLDRPIAPNKKSIVFLGLLLGLITGILISIIYENLKGNIFSHKQIENILGLPFIFRLTFASVNDLNKKIELISTSKLDKSKGETLSFLILGDLSNNEIDNISKIINKSKLDLDLLITNNILEANKSTLQIILISLPGLSKKILVDLKNNLVFQDNQTIGFILFDKTIFN